MKIGLVLEGGSMRALFSSGVLDTFLDEGLDFDGIIGVSAGALFAPNFYSKQKGRALRYNKRFCKDLRFISMPSFILTGNVVNKKFAYYDMSYIHDKFDNETFMKHNKGFWITVTNIETGKAEYLKTKNILEDLELLRATAALPFFSKIVDINGKKYLDGGIADSVPVLKCKELGFDRIVVILTQPINYKKQPLKDFMMKVMKVKYKKYPNFLNTLACRYEMYNQTIEEIVDMENKKEIFVIRPPQSLEVGTIERNPEILQAVYDLGVKEAKQVMDDLKRYLEA